MSKLVIMNSAIILRGVTLLRKIDHTLYFMRDQFLTERRRRGNRLKWKKSKNLFSCPEFKITFLYWKNKHKLILGVRLSACLWDWQSAPSADSETFLPLFTLRRLRLHDKKLVCCDNHFPPLGKIPSCKIPAETSRSWVFFFLSFSMAGPEQPKSCHLGLTLTLLGEQITEPALLKC